MKEKIFIKIFAIQKFIRHRFWFQIPLISKIQEFSLQREAKVLTGRIMALGEEV